MCIQDVQIARSQTIRSITSGNSGKTVTKFAAWPRRVRFMLSAPGQVALATVDPTRFQVFIGSDEAILANLIVDTYVYNPVAISFDDFGAAIGGAITIVSDFDGLDNQWPIVEVELTLPNGMDQPISRTPEG